MVLVDQHAMMVADMIRTIGTEEVLIAVDPPGAGGFKTAPDAGQGRP